MFNNNSNNLIFMLLLMKSYMNAITLHIKTTKPQNLIKFIIRLLLD